MVSSRLTNEELKKSFNEGFHSDFDMAEHLIHLVKVRIQAGEDVNVNQFLEDVRKHPSKYKAEELSDG